MFSQVMTLAGKDLRLFLFRGHGVVQAALLGILLIFVFSLAAAGQKAVSKEWTAAIFWLATCFGQILIFNSLYALEDRHKAREGLLLGPFPVQTIWVAKALAGGVALLLVQVVFIPACMVFLGQDSIRSWTGLLGLIGLIDAGLVVLCSLLGAMGTEQAGRDSLLTVVLFPLLLPLLLTGIRLGAHVLGGSGVDDPWAWVRLAAAFDAVFAGLALILFPVLYRE